MGARLPPVALRLCQWSRLIPKKIKHHMTSLTISTLPTFQHFFSHYYWHSRNNPEIQCMRKNTFGKNHWLHKTLSHLKDVKGFISTIYEFYSPILAGSKKKRFVWQTEPLYLYFCCLLFVVYSMTKIFQTGFLLKSVIISQRCKKMYFLRKFL